MHTQTNISHTGGKGLQNASSQGDQSVREAPEQTDQPIRQAAANPAIQGHLAEAPGNMVEVNALFIAEDPQVDSAHRLEAAKHIR